MSFFPSHLPTELLTTTTTTTTTTNVWNNKSLSPLTPPWTSTFERRKTAGHTTLPPIASLDRHLQNHMAPLTPPDDLPPPTYSPHFSRLPSISTNQPSLFTDSIQPVDWIDFSRTRSAQFIAEKTCEMICYLWFQPSSPSSSPNDNTSPILNRHSPASTLQLVATPTFVHFMQKLLETTQVSQSVIVLSLRYIYDLKRNNPAAEGQPGSEFRVAVAALMLANKFLDDNTYTNKTWSEVSGIDLTEINDMEREFLLGVRFDLYVQKSAYESWLNLLKGLVMAKERDSRRLLRRTRTPVRQAQARHHHPASASAITHASRYRPAVHRARSTSPSQTTRVTAAMAMMSVTEAPAQVGFKRSAEAAFSPTSATFSHRDLRAKRPVVSALTIPETQVMRGPSSYSPLEGLQGFADMSLGGGGRGGEDSPDGLGYVQQQAGRRDRVPETLVTGYTLADRRRDEVPQNLYFYTLSCSPLGAASSTPSSASYTNTSTHSQSEVYDNRKGRLRYHQPPPPSSYDYYTSSPGRYLISPPSSSSVPPPPPFSSLSKYHYTNPHSQPAYVQSASTSPAVLTLHHHSLPLPHFRDTVWTLPAPAYQQESGGGGRGGGGNDGVSEAPFANAGPPGVSVSYFYPSS